MPFQIGHDAGARRHAAALALFGCIATALALSADRGVASAFAAMQTEAGRQGMLLLTQLGNGAVDFALAGAVLVAGWALGRSRLVQAGLRAAVALSAAGIAVQVLKHLACRARPTAAAPGTFFHGVPCLGGEPAFFSFPSGHATMVTALALALGLRVPALRLPAAAGVAVVMVSRVYLGAHFPSDVLAGATLGAIAGILAAAPIHSPAPTPLAAPDGPSAPQPPAAPMPR